MVTTTQLSHYLLKIRHINLTFLVNIPAQKMRERFEGTVEEYKAKVVRAVTTSGKAK